MSEGTDPAETTEITAVLAPLGRYTMMPWSRMLLCKAHEEETLLTEVGMQIVSHGDDIHHTVGQSLFRQGSSIGVSSITGKQCI